MQRQPARSVTLIRRHSIATRLTHWLNVLCLSVLLLSGLQIFNAQPALYWGQYGADDDPELLKIGATEDGQTGYIRVGALTLTTTGILGASKVEGQIRSAHHGRRVFSPRGRHPVTMRCNFQ